MVDDNLCSEGTADGPVGECGGNGILNALDVGDTAAIEGGAEGDHQDFLLANFVGIAGIVQGGIAGIQTEVIGAGFLALHQLLLLVGQGIPGSLGGSTLGIGVLGAGLNIDGINQLGHSVGSSLIGGSIGPGKNRHAQQHGYGAEKCNEFFHIFFLLIK